MRMRDNIQYMMARMEKELEKIMNLKRPRPDEAAELLYDLMEEYPDLTDDQLFTKFRLMLRRGDHRYHDKIVERRGRKSTFERGMVKGG